MVPYFPFREQFDATMGARPYTSHDRLIEVDDQYHAEIQLKKTLLERDHAFYYRTQEITRTAQWEVLERVLDDMARSAPEHFQLNKRGNEWTWHNGLLGEVTQFHIGDHTSLPYEPLDWVGRQVQEDLVLLSADAEARLVGGQLCFPNGWSLSSKWDQSLLAVHTRPMTLDKIEPSIKAANMLMQRMRPDRPVWRASWNFKLVNDLEMSDRERPRIKADFAERAPTLTSETIGAQVWLRIERQTFLKLPQSGQTLFVIHTYQSRLDTEASDPNRARLMLATLRSTPRDMRNYKAITPIEDALFAYLERHSLQATITDDQTQRSSISQA